MTPATVARLIVERAGDLIAAQTRGELPAAPTIDMVLAHPPVADGIACCGRLPGRQVVLLAALAAGRSVIGRWRLAYPDLAGPLEALAAAERWAAEPTDAAADEAARAADRAIRESLGVWCGPDRAAAWAGRTAAWVGMSPKYGWPAVAALAGACEAGGAEPVVAAVSACLTELCSGHAEPSAAADRGRM
jgi:hypothetical protein